MAAQLDSGITILASGLMQPACIAVDKQLRLLDEPRRTTP